MDKCLIIVVIFNTPEFILPQYQSINKFFKYPFDYLICNNCPDENQRGEIRQICESNGIRHEFVPPERVQRGDASLGCATSCQYAMETFGISHNGYVLLLDCDMFFVSDFYPEKYLNIYEIFGIVQHREHIVYLTNQFLLINMGVLPDKQKINLMCGTVDNIKADVGGYLHYYLKDHPEIRFNCLSYWPSMSYNVQNVEDKVPDRYLKEYLLRDIELSKGYSEVLLDSCVIHYRSGTNWNGFSSDLVTQRKNNLFDLINNLTVMG